MSIMEKSVEFGMSHQLRKVKEKLEKTEKQDFRDVKPEHRTKQYLEIQKYADRVDYIPTEDLTEVVSKIADVLIRKYSRAKQKKFELEKKKDQSDTPEDYEDLKSDIFWEKRRKEDAAEMLGTLRKLLVKTTWYINGTSWKTLVKDDIPDPEPEIFNGLIDEVKEENEDAGIFLERIYDSHDAITGNIVSTMEDIADDLGHNNYSYIQSRAEALLKKKANERDLPYEGLSVHNVMYAGYYDRWEKSREVSKRSMEEGDA